MPVHTCVVECTSNRVNIVHQAFFSFLGWDDDVELRVLGCRLTY